MVRVLVLCLVTAGGCGGDGAGVDNPLTDPEDGPPAGNPDGTCTVPSEAGLADVSSPLTVVGTGSREFGEIRNDRKQRRPSR
ncbi:MAG TPA: hypothetical protein VML75_26465 [Kofleriaceae bacterium]|nr:hypothetical protein [Kofleriaceae bacterium]